MSGADEARATGQAATLIRGVFGDWRERFSAITRRARSHFESRDWQAVQRDSARRLDLYGEAVGEALALLATLLQDRMEDRALWTMIRGAYAVLVEGRHDAPLARTFFNSITRKLFRTIGVDPRIEFVGDGEESGAADSAAAPETPGPAAFPTIDAGASVEVGFARDGAGAASIDGLVRRILEHSAFGAAWEDLDRDTAQVSAALQRDPGLANLTRIDMARAVFYRGKGAYLVGRAWTGEGPRPFLLALVHPSGGVAVDALLLSEDEVSIVFSFARSYFFVEMERPADLVAFLGAIMPRKPLAELYNAVGCDKHGKTELYHALLRHLDRTDDRFEFAPGQRGMVMCVFTLPGLGIVFKVIRDRFAAPKTVTHDEVRAKYRLVFRHDRAGRLVDAQEFEHLTFDRGRFQPELLRVLTELCAETVRVMGDQVIVRHLYTERRLTPLDLYLKDAPEDAARAAVLDYGQVLRDLAATNIFPGDMLPKNFGVSRHGRLIFYDYDELCLLSECRFRMLPPPRDDWEEGAAEPAFHVGERDIFPEEFRAFLGFKGPLLTAFLEAHEELLGVRFWHRMQERLQRGEVIDIYPYAAARQLRPGSG